MKQLLEIKVKYLSEMADLIDNMEKELESFCKKSSRTRVIPSIAVQKRMVKVEIALQAIKYELWKADLAECKRETSL